MLRYSVVLVATLLATGSLKAQDRTEISPREAALHLIKKVEAVYPPWAKAEGVQGIVSFRINIDVNGRVVAMQRQQGGSGQVPLVNAARIAVHQYQYRPFKTDGHPAPVTTLVSVAFTLRGSSAPHPLPAPKFSSEDFTWFEYGEPSTEISPAMRKWLATSDLREATERPPCDSSDVPKVFEIPTKRPSYHLYLVVPPNCAWTASNNGVEAVEENKRGVAELVFDGTGSGFYVSPHRGSPYPDIFIVNSEGARTLEVEGYSRAADTWGQLYCGGFGSGSDGEEEEDIRVCQ
jgi:TonB-like protein